MRIQLYIFVKLIWNQIFEQALLLQTLAKLGYEPGVIALLNSFDNTRADKSDIFVLIQDGASSMGAPLVSNERDML